MKAMDGQQTFNCDVIRVVDGDTIELIVDVGFRMTYRDNFRLSDINAPEIRTSEGKASKLWLENYINSIKQNPDDHFKARVIKHGKYRWIASIRVYKADLFHTTLNKELVDAGHAIYMKY